MIKEVTLYSIVSFILGINAGLVIGVIAGMIFGETIGFVVACAVCAIVDIVLLDYTLSKLELFDGRIVEELKKDFKMIMMSGKI